MTPSTIVLVVILFLVSNFGAEARYAMRRNATKASIHTIITSCMRFFFCFFLLEEVFSLSSADGIGGGDSLPIDITHISSLFVLYIDSKDYLKINVISYTLLDSCILPTKEEIENFRLMVLQRWRKC